MKPVRQSFGGGWTEIKLDKVRRYLEAYTTVMSKQPYELLYIDAFAGTGYWVPKQTNVADQVSFSGMLEDKPVAEGSAKIALGIKRPFDKYHFVEIHNKSVQELEKLKRAYPELSERIIIKKGNANAYLLELCESHDWRKARAVLFLDPFGMEVEWRTVEAIAATHAIDLWYLFPIGAMGRMLTKSGKIDEKWQDKLDAVLGEKKWRELFYRAIQVQDLFENRTMFEKHAETRAIYDYILERLRRVFVGVAENPLLLTYPKKNVPLFLLCFACGNVNGRPIALRIAKSILDK